MRCILPGIAVVMLAAGCNKSGPAATGGKAAAEGGPPAASPPPKPQAEKPEPPRLSPQHRFTTGIREVNRVAITADGTRVAATSDGLGNRPRTEVWDLTPKPNKVRDLPGVMRALSPDGKLLARSGAGFETELVDVGTGAVVGTIGDDIHFQAFHRFVGPDRLLLVRPNQSPAGDKGRALRVGLYDARTGKQESGFEIPSPDLADVRGPVNGGREIVVGWGATSRVEVWDLGTGKMVRGVTLPDARPKGSWSNFEASPDGKRVTARRRTDRPVPVYDTTTGAEVATAGRETESAFVPGRDLILGQESWIGEGPKAYSGWRAFDLGKKAIVADLPGGYLFPAVSADGRVMVTMADRAKPELLVWDLTRIP